MAVSKSDDEVRHLLQHREKHAAGDDGAGQRLLVHLLERRQCEQADRNVRPLVLVEGKHREREEGMVLLPDRNVRPHPHGDDGALLAAGVQQAGAEARDLVAHLLRGNLLQLRRGAPLGHLQIYQGAARHSEDDLS